MGDAHLAVGLRAYADPGATLLPVLPRSVDDGVRFESTPPGVPTDAQLLAIDGVEIEALLTDLMGLAMVDGRDPIAARRAVEHDLPRYHALRYGLRPEHELHLRGGDGELRLVVTSVGREGLTSLRQGRRVAWSGLLTPGGLPTLERARAAILRAPTFGVADMAAWAGEVERLLALVEPHEPLLIDLRGNEGGLRPNAQAILAHLVEAPAPEWLGLWTRVRRDPVVALGTLSWPWGSVDERLRPAPLQRRAGRWWLPGDPLPLRPAAPHHHGPVALLVDARTGSAANGFVLALKLARPDVLIVGESLGGACDRHIGELPLVWTAPHSGASVMMSLLELEHAHPPGCTPGRGLPPDLAVHPTAADLARGGDPWVDLALAHLP